MTNLLGVRGGGRFHAKELSGRLDVTNLGLIEYNESGVEIFLQWKKNF